MIGAKVPILRSSTTKLRERRVPHCLADAVPEEPRSLKRNLQHPVKLVGANALLAGANKVDCLKPLVQRQVAFLKDRPDANGELLAAFLRTALVEAVALDALRVLAGRLGANASQLVVPANGPALRADHSVRPQESFHMRERCGLIVEVRAEQDGHCSTS